ncbi:sister chromatid cohesion 1 protein 3-like isoform X2 [Olea europaea var. sylvestris]|uniref:sister chromatid cohesion 1 protein 3-like isoform X2 n=1 Tax=Olea europaea var. sylvestris TaxID=158386 RepID=UPI000C1D5C5E|nr:sister chromatid cohesion 1 protein 3-like isoform X2 [Olea europaea var. sylvestris]
MFYSHTFLARKGPLGTVWCAAHLQHKLKKSHYISTNILSRVDRIMYPEVPIALRMSGHLLLGVARIYSKQVDYLYEDCHVVQITINKAFTSVNVNLPEDANHAPFHSVTLPEKFELDALDLDNYSWCEYDHLNSYDDITLTEQIPTGKDPYIIIAFDGDSPRDTVGAVQIEEDVQEDTIPVFEDQSPRKHQLVDEGIAEEINPPDLPSPEFQRDANHGSDFNYNPILSDWVDADLEIVNQISKDIETHTPHTEKPEEPSKSQKHQASHSYNHSESNMPFVHPSPEEEIRATPPVAQPKVRKRKRKQPFDKATVLSNGYMRNSLNDTSDIRHLKNYSCSSLEIWKLNNKIRKDGALFEPLITGVCAELRDSFREEFISTKPHLVALQEAHEGAEVDPSPSSRHDLGVEVGCFCNNEYNSTEIIMPSIPTPTTPSRRNDFTVDNANFEFQSDRAETIEEAGTIPKSAMGASTGTFYSDMETPKTFDGEHSALSDIPELATSAGELGFLEQDDNSPAGTPKVGFLSKNQGTPEEHTLSSRTRALAQYLKKQASLTPVPGNSEGSSGDLSLLKILEGKPRKICARMFSETLVLKNYGLVDVHQEKPYDDINLKVTPKLFKEQFSG